MSETVRFFETNGRRAAVVLPFDPDRLIDEWAGLRPAMIREMPDVFTRNEWAHLIQTLDGSSLHRALEGVLGRPCEPGAADRVLHARGPVAVWLSSNVNLLGPLVLVYLSLTGAPIRMKAGSRGPNLTSAFVDFLRRRLPKDSVLLSHLDAAAVVDAFDRSDPRNADMAAAAAVRLAFGTDAACRDIDHLPHPLDSVGFSFHDRRSEAWLRPGRFSDDDLKTLIKVFSIYGQSACTAPRRVVLIDGTADDGAALQERFLRLWPDAVPERPEMAVASSNLLGVQWAAATGWTARAVEGGRAVVAVGRPTMEPVSTWMTLSVVPASLDEALATLAPNIQTIGHAGVEEAGPVLAALARHGVKRFVPVADMHLFGPTWDGFAYLRSCFAEMTLRSA